MSIVHMSIVHINRFILFLQDIDRKHNPIYNVFEIWPLEGRMNPFQSIIFEVK